MPETVPENLPWPKMEKKGPVLPPRPEELDYITFPSLAENPYREEGFKEKMLRKMGENPFVPVGLGVTVFALTYGMWQMKTGNKVMSQKMMRLRVGAQGFTVFALLGGVLYQAQKERKAKSIPQK